MSVAAQWMRVVDAIADEARAAIDRELAEAEVYGADEVLKRRLRSSVIDRLAGRPFSLPTESTEAVECSEGCPIVIFAEEWDYHAQWHADEKAREANRG